MCWKSQFPHLLCLREETTSKRETTTGFSATFIEKIMTRCKIVCSLFLFASLFIFFALKRELCFNVLGTGGASTQPSPATLLSGLRRAVSSLQSTSSKREGWNEGSSAFSTAELVEQVYWVFLSENHFVFGKAFVVWLIILLALCYRFFFPFLFCSASTMLMFYQSPVLVFSKYWWRLW